MFNKVLTVQLFSVNTRVLIKDKYQNNYIVGECGSKFKCYVGVSISCSVYASRHVLLWKNSLSWSIKKDKFREYRFSCLKYFMDNGWIGKRKRDSCRWDYTATPKYCIEEKTTTLRLKNLCDSNVDVNSCISTEKPNILKLGSSKP